MNTKNIISIGNYSENLNDQSLKSESTLEKLEAMFELHQTIQQDLQNIRKLSLQLGFTEARLATNIQKRMKLAESVHKRLND